MAAARSTGRASRPSSWARSTSTRTNLPTSSRAALAARSTCAHFEPFDRADTSSLSPADETYADLGEDWAPSYASSPAIVGIPTRRASSASRFLLALEAQLTESTAGSKVRRLRASITTVSEDFDRPDEFIGLPPRTSRPMCRDSSCAPTMSIASVLATTSPLSGKKKRFVPRSPTPVSRTDRQPRAHDRVVPGPHPGPRHDERSHDGRGAGRRDIAFTCMAADNGTPDSPNGDGQNPGDCET